MIHRLTRNQSFFAALNNASTATPIGRQTDHASRILRSAIFLLCVLSKQIVQPPDPAVRDHYRPVRFLI